VNSFILRQSGEFIQTHVRRAFLERMIQDLNENGQGCVAELFFDLDGFGIADWEDHI
jgi:hypothetical protein